MAKMFKCGVCGFVHQGEEAPEFCPKCGAPKEKLIALTEEAAQLVVRSKKTNLYHQQIIDLLAKADDIAQAGIADDLDPNCVKAFKAVAAQSTVLRGIILAELEGHMKKGKWGI